MNVHCLYTCALSTRGHLSQVPTDSFSCGGDVMVYAFDNNNNNNKLSLPAPFLFCSCVCFCLYGPFICISFHKLSRQLSVFSRCSSSLISVLLVLSTIYLFMKISFSPSGWLSSKHQLTNIYHNVFVTLIKYSTHTLHTHTNTLTHTHTHTHTDTHTHTHTKQKCHNIFGNTIKNNILSVRL